MERKTREAKKTANSLEHSCMSIKDQGKAESGPNHAALWKEWPVAPGLVAQVCTMCTQHKLVLVLSREILFRHF